jgi:hypothetical protein
MEKYADLKCDFSNDGRSITVSIREDTVELALPAFNRIDNYIRRSSRNVGFWNIAAYGGIPVWDPTDNAVEIVLAHERDGVSEDLEEEGNESSEDNFGGMHCGRLQGCNWLG